MISVQNITFAYRKGYPVWQDFSVDFPAGGIYGLLGRNGVGKTTLLYLVSGLLRTQRGRVDVDGHEPQQRNPDFLREMFIVPEDMDLPSVSLSSYVAAIRPFYPRWNDEILRMVLGEFGMEDVQNLGELSMGQKKKVYMAIALATDTRVLLLDEPTNGLDIPSKSQFRKAVVQGMRKDKTIIISTHQVHDVENLLDHVTIVSEQGVLLEKQLGDDPVDLEKLFVETVDY